MTSRGSRMLELALLTIPRAWRDMVRDDLVDQGQPGARGTLWRVLQAVGIAISLHWVFTRASLMSDMREAIRSLARTPGFTLGAIGTFALGIGVNLAVFAAVDRMLFRALPYADSDRIVVMGNYPLSGPGPYGTIAAAYTVAAKRLPAFTAVAASTWNSESYRLVPNPDGARYLSFVPVSDTMLHLLGVQPILGRDFTREDARSGAKRVLLSYAAWQQDFGGRPDVIGRRLWGPTAGTEAEVAGVLPARFFPPQVIRFSLVWDGLTVRDFPLESAGPRDATTPPLFRLAPGVSLQSAQAQVATLQAALAPALARPGAAPTVVRIVPLRESLFGRYTTYLLLVFAAATLVLLVGCANLASLMLVRARAREHRAAVQLSLGASFGRLVRTAIEEALLLAVLGSALAVVVLKLTSHALVVWLPPVFSAYAAPIFEPRILVFALLLATTAAIVAGIWPGWRAARVDVISTLQRSATRVSSGGLRGGAAILCGEIAVSLVLVASAALAGRSLVRLVTTDLGFQSDRLWLINATVPPSTDPALLLHQYNEELAVLRAVPGVDAVAGARILPNIGAVDAPMWTGDSVGRRWAVTDDLVEALGLRLVAGRDMSAAEVRADSPVGLLSESGVELVWPGLRPPEAVGRFLQFPGEAPREVVGVVSDVRDAYAVPVAPSLYVPIDTTRFHSMEFAVRMSRTGALAPVDLAGRFRTRGLAPQLVAVTSFADRLAESVVNDKFRAELLSGFGLAALVLTVIGLYAVQTFNVAQRRTEFGVRLSLGATPTDLWRMLIRQALAPVLCGIGLGLVGVYWVAQFVQSLLTAGVDARGPVFYLVVAATLLVVATVATVVPARRAARTDPAVVLRAQ